MARTNRGDENDRGRKSLNSTILIVLLLSFLFLVVWLMVSSFSDKAYEQASSDIKVRLIKTTQKKAQELALVMNDMLSSGMIASSYLSDDVDDMFSDSHIEIIKDSNRNLYEVALVDIEGKGISTSGEIDLGGSDYFSPSLSPRFSFTNDDAIEGRKALVCEVPVMKDDKPSAYLIQYIDVETLKLYIPIEGNNRDNSVLIVDNAGNRMYSSGKPWIVVKSNFRDTLNNTQIDNTDIDTVMANIENGIDQNFVANLENRGCFFVAFPAGDTGWTLIDIIDKNTYIDNIILDRSSYEQTMAKKIAAIVFGIVLLLSAIVISYRVKDMKNSKVLENKADTDLLTGLNNKLSTERKVQECLEAEPHVQHLMFLFDIDNFKKINDTMGHAFGDQVLKSLGEQLSMEFRKTDILGRIGGDEFAILLKDIKDDEIILKEGDKILQFFRQFKVGDYVKYSATASIGAAIYPRDGKDFQELYKSADNALYEAKKQGKNRLIYYNSDMADNVKKRDEEAKKNPGART